MAFDKIVGVDGTTYQFPTLVRQRIADNIEQAGSVENLAVIDALAPALATKSDTTHNHTLASLTSNGIDELGDVEIGVVGSNGIALADKHTLQYESATSKWRNKVASGGVTVGDTRPAEPIPGDAWFDSNDGTLYVYYADGNTNQWVQVKANSALEGTILSRLGALESRATALEAVPDYAVNEIINGAFEVNQRSFTSTVTDGTYTFDRWKYEGANGGTGSITVSAQAFTPGAAPVAGYEGKNYLRMAITGTSGSTFASIRQPIEDVRTLSGETVTLSFWAKASAGGSSINPCFYQTFGTGGSAVVKTFGGAQSIGTSWTRYSFTVSLPSMTGKTIGVDSNLSLYIFFSDNNLVGSGLGIQNNTFDVWGVQVEAGSTATPFHRNSSSIQGELAACQRYYYRVNGSWAHTLGMTFQGATSVATIGFTYPYKVTMRANAHTVESSGIEVTDPGVSEVAVTSSFPTYVVGSESGSVTLTRASGTFTAYKVYGVRIGGSPGYIAWSAEY